MKKIMSLEYFSNGKYNYYNHCYKNFVEGTPTLYLAWENSDQARERNHYKWGIVNGYCRVCNNLFTAPGAIDTAIRKKEVVCPNCGHTHSIKNILISDNSSDILPLCITASLYEKKESLILRFKYNAIIFGEDIYNSFHRVDVKETFNLNYVAKTATWSKSIYDGEKEKKEHREIGFLADLTNPISSVINYIPYSGQDKHGVKTSNMLAYMRKYITAKMLKQNYHSKKMFFWTNNTDEMTKNNLLYLARKIRFWDEPENAYFPLYKNNVYNNKSIIRDLNLPNLTKTECELSTLLQHGKNYDQAFLTVFHLPDTNLVRKYLNYFCIHAIEGAYKEETKKFANILLPYFNENPNNIETVCNYYKYLAKYYPQKHFENIKNTNMYKLNDTISLYRLLNEENLLKFNAKVPRFKDLHDYLSIMVAKQPANEINYHIPDHIVRRLNMQLENSKCEVLTKYSDVLKTGLNLHNCAASYKKRINENLQLVLVTDDIGQAKVLLEIQGERIVQAKLMNNRPVSADNTYNSLILDFMKKANLTSNTNDINLEKNMKPAKTA